MQYEFKHDMKVKQTDNDYPLCPPGILPVRGSLHNIPGRTHLGHNGFYHKTLKCMTLHQETTNTFLS